MKKEDIGEPPLELEDNEVIAKVLQNRGNSFDVLVPQSHLAKVEKCVGSQDDHLLVGLNPAIRNSVFVRRNGFVVVSLENLGPNGKMKGEITNVVLDVRDWQKTLVTWPTEFGTLVKEDNALELPPESSSEEYSEDEHQEEN